MTVRKDVYVTMPDGIKLCVDIYSPDSPGKYPALLSYSPYSKDVQKLPIVPGPIDFRLGNGGIEAGDSEYFVSRGYVHIIADARGTGKSQGAYRFFSRKEQEDGYELIEWIAQQPWCDGNVGMLGMSYFAMIQFLVAALRPPHLKAIFAHDALTDIYRMWFHHGGIFHFGFFFQWWSHVPAHTIEPLDISDSQLRSRVAAAKGNPDVQANPVCYITLDHPEKNVPLFDALIHPEDGPYYWERSAYTKFDKIQVPTYILTRWTAWPTHMAGAFSAYAGIHAPKILRVGLPDTWEGFSRPWCENHELILRWYDHWLKGIDTGIMEEPPVNIFVREKGEWRTEVEWPLSRTNWTKYFLRQGGTLSVEQPHSSETPDRFTSDPSLKRGQQLPGIVYQTEPLERDTEITGPIALFFYAALDKQDANWMVEIHDLAPDGNAKLVTMGWLKASYRDIEANKSSPFKPYHPHTRSVSVVPGAITEYAMEIRETSYLFRSTHRISLKIKGQDAYWEGKEVFREMGFHLPNSKKTEHSIHHSPGYPSHLLLPVIG